MEIERITPPKNCHPILRAIKESQKVTYTALEKTIAQEVVRRQPHLPAGVCTLDVQLTGHDVEQSIALVNQTKMLKPGEAGVIAYSQGYFPFASERRIRKKGVSAKSKRYSSWKPEEIAAGKMQFTHIIAAMKEVMPGYWYVFGDWMNGKSRVIQVFSLFNSARGRLMVEDCKYREKQPKVRPYTNGAKNFSVSHIPSLTSDKEYDVLFKNVVFLTGDPISNNGPHTATPEEARSTPNVSAFHTCGRCTDEANKNGRDERKRFDARALEELCTLVGLPKRETEEYFHCHHNTFAYFLAEEFYKKIHHMELAPVFPRPKDETIHFLEKLTQQVLVLAPDGNLRPLYLTEVELVLWDYVGVENYERKKRAGLL